MKATKLILSILFIFSSVEGFSQTIQDAAICTTTGSKASFTVDYPNASTYEWQLKTLNVDWTTITSSNASSVYSDYNSPTLNITKSSTLPVTGTLYRVIVNDGFNDLISNEATLTVDPTPVSKTITGASPICIGDNKILTYGTGSIGTIQWQYSTTSSSEGFEDIDGETELIYTASDLQETTWFRVMNTSGECSPVYSPTVQVNVNTLAVPGNIDGGDINVCKTQNSTTLTLYNYEGAIQWQKAPDLGGAPGNFSTIASATSATYLAAALTATTYFRALVSSGVCASENTDPVLINVDPLPVSKIITGASPACIGGSKVLVYGTGSLGDIQWQYSTTSSSAGFDDINGETELVYLASDLQETTWFRVMNTNETCSPVYSAAVQVLINPPAVSGIIEGGNNIVSKSSNATELTLKAYKGTIQWQKAASLTDAYTDITSSTSSTYIATGLTETTYFRALVSSGECSKVASKPIFINVDSEFKVTTFPNPFETEFNLNLTSLSLDPIELKIYDMLGRLIENHQIKSSEINSMRIGTTYPPGFFTVLIKQGQQERDVKVLKK
jgi:hypothetical protein